MQDPRHVQRFSFIDLGLGREHKKSGDMYVAKIDAKVPGEDIYDLQLDVRLLSIGWSKCFDAVVKYETAEFGKNKAWEFVNEKNIVERMRTTMDPKDQKAMTRLLDYAGVHAHTHTPLRPQVRGKMSTHTHTHTHPTGPPKALRVGHTHTHTGYARNCR